MRQIVAIMLARRIQTIMMAHSKNAKCKREGGRKRGRGERKSYTSLLAKRVLNVISNDMSMRQAFLLITPDHKRRVGRQRQVQLTLITEYQFPPACFYRRCGSANCKACFVLFFVCVYLRLRISSHPMTIAGVPLDSVRRFWATLYHLYASLM